METLDALVASPKSARRTFTLERILIHDLTSLTVLTGFVFCVIVLIIRACHTL